MTSHLAFHAGNFEKKRAGLLEWMLADLPDTFKCCRVEGKIVASTSDSKHKIAVANP